MKARNVDSTKSLDMKMKLQSIMLFKIHSIQLRDLENAFVFLNELKMLAF